MMINIIMHLFVYSSFLDSESSFIITWFIRSVLDSNSTYVAAAAFGQTDRSEAIWNFHYFSLFSALFGCKKPPRANVCTQLILTFRSFLCSDQLHAWSVMKVCLHMNLLYWLFCALSNQRYRMKAQLWQGICTCWKVWITWTSFQIFQ